MYKHEKQLLKEVRVDKPNPNYANMMQEQLGGPHGELKAALQYMSQSFRIKDQRIKDLFLDISSEELGHMEMVATTVNLLNGQQPNAAATSVGSVEASVQNGLLPALSNASGYYWTGAYVNETGDLAADILSNIAAEQRGKGRLPVPLSPDQRQRRPGNDRFPSKPRGSAQHALPYRLQHARGNGLPGRLGRHAGFAAVFQPVHTRSVFQRERSVEPEAAQIQRPEPAEPAARRHDAVVLVLLFRKEINYGDRNQSNKQVSKMY